MTERTRGRGDGGAAERLEARIAELEQRLEELERERPSARRRLLMERLLPAEATTHFRTAAREQLRGVSVLIDHWIRGLEAGDVERARTNSGTERIVIE